MKLPDQSHKLVSVQFRTGNFFLFISKFLLKLILPIMSLIKLFTPLIF